MTDELAWRMRQTWDALARRDAMHFIATERRDWDRASFLDSGRQTLRSLLELVGAPLGRQGGIAVDLGCGIGRLSFALAGRHDRVIGVDVSAEMIRQARALGAEIGAANVDFRLNEGRDLAFLPTGSCDLGFSFVVLQHIPDRAIVLGYLAELARVVRVGGHVLVQVPVYQRRWLVRPWRIAQGTYRRVLAAAEARGWVPPERGVAFRGSRLLAHELDAMLARGGLSPLAVCRRPTTYRYCDDTIVYAERRPLDPATGRPGA
jgi:SAM-dependent methyltransferase